MLKHDIIEADEMSDKMLGVQYEPEPAVDTKEVSDEERFWAIEHGASTPEEITELIQQHKKEFGE